MTRIDTVTAAPPSLTDEVRALDLQEAWQLQRRRRGSFKEE
jgi:hypothetical protein